MHVFDYEYFLIAVIAYRSQYGSVDPAGIIGAGLLATGISTLVAVIYCKMCTHTLR